MGGKRLTTAYKAIAETFNQLERKAFTEKALIQVVSKNRSVWGLSEDRGAHKIIDFMVEQGDLHENILTNQNAKQYIIYSWKTKDEMTVISAIKAQSYFAYYTAMFLHQLTLQIPKVFYLNFEHSTKYENNSILNVELTQEDIDEAFLLNQRKTGQVHIYKDKKINITNSKKTDHLGVIKHNYMGNSYHLTDRERTLIDIAVRPNYSGGVFEVLEAYRIAQQHVNPQKIASYLQTLNYKYPYSQLIGFYMEKAGYPEDSLKFFTKKIKNKFYATYNIRNPEFNQRWQIYFPKEL